jgi:sulfite reductase alpha subunit-like flavoprotein
MNLKKRFFFLVYSFAVLGLGSTSYQQFCAFGKFIDITFKELGGTRLLPLACADELNNQEKTVQTWLSDITTALCKQFLIEGINYNNFRNEESSADQPSIHFSARFITSFQEEKEDVLHGKNFYF